MKRFKNLVIAILMIFTFASTVFAIGAVADGEWVADGTNWKYLKNGEAVVNDWAFVKQGEDYTYYYFDAMGHMVTGINKIGEEYYSFNNDGVPTQKGKDIKCGGESYKIGNKGLIQDFNDDAYAEYLKEQEEKAAEKAFQEKQKAENERIKASIEASKEAYKIEHAAEIAASEAAKQAEEAAKAQLVAAKAAEEAAKHELLISSANREKLQAETNKATSRKMAIRNLATETKRQLNERRFQMITDAKTEFAINPKAEIDKMSDLFNEVVNEYASVIDDMLDVLSYKYKMRDESYDDAVRELSEVIDTAKTKFADDFAKIGEVKD